MLLANIRKNPRKILGSGTCLMVSCFLSACSTSSESFDSEMVEGVGAKSISQVNNMVDKGVIQDATNFDDEQNKVVSPIFATTCVQNEHNEHFENIKLSNKTILQRQPERHIKVWIAPFQDAMGNFYEGSVIHTLLRSSYWHLSPNPYSSLANSANNLPHIN
jgi:hypothetical protein